MRNRHAILVTFAILGSLALGAQPAPPAQAPQPSAPDGEAAQPPTPAPTQPPPPPPSQAPAPAPAGPSAPVTGQWVYTNQYGWVWMPYGAAYTHVPPGGSPPVMYLYEPAYGWCWVDAPWVWGWGPRPFFGVLGPIRFGWWGNGYGHWYGYRGGYRNWGRRGWRGGFARPYPRGYRSWPRPRG